MKNSNSVAKLLSTHTNYVGWKLF